MGGPDEDHMGTNWLPDDLATTKETVAHLDADRAVPAIRRGAASTGRRPPREANRPGTG